MQFGTTSGRGFESALAPYFFGAIVIVSVGLWLWFHFDLRRRERDDSSPPDNYT